MQELTNYHQACNELAHAFIDKYFDMSAQPDWYWVADRPGEVLFVNDYWFSIEEIAAAMELDATFEQLSDWHEYRNNAPEKRFNFNTWIKTGQVYNGQA